jgi:hypothetical protein
VSTYHNHQRNRSQVNEVQEAEHHEKCENRANGVIFPFLRQMIENFVEHGIVIVRLSDDIANVTDRFVVNDSIVVRINTLQIAVLFLQGL